MSEPSAPSGRAVIVGTGLIGGSIGLALRAQGWHVSGVDRNETCVARALELGALDVIGEDPDADLTVVATPVGAIADAVRHALGTTHGLVTDVGSVKSPFLDLMGDPRYVGGHPMAGSEQDGVDGARADLFDGATWVLTPVPGTDDASFATLRALVASLGAEPVALAPDRHDRMVALVSHVPHLTAASLMQLADERAEEHRALLRLAAGGFRDMTRIASGHPGIWPDICAENRDAIVEELGHLITALGEVREIVANGERAALTGRLERARLARRNLPARLETTEDLAELRVPIADEAGSAARIFLLAGELDVSIADFEVVHSAEGNAGVLVLVAELDEAVRLRVALTERGEHASVHPLS